MNSLKDIDFKELIAKETNGRMRIRLLALSHIKDGKNKTQTAIYLKVNRRSVNEWAKRFFGGGLDALNEKPRTGRPCLLSEEQLILLKDYIHTHSIKPTGGRLKGMLLVDFINKEFGIEYSLDNIYRLLHKLNFSWITSRSKHPKQSEEVQADFKKIPNKNDL